MEIPSVPPFYGENIPVELKNRRQWVCWRYERRDDKLVKVPLIPRGDKPIHADVTDPNCLGSFDEAVETARKNGWGLGFCFFRGDGLTGIDLDKLDQWRDEAERIVRQAGSYAELSPSGKGIHLIVKGRVEEAIKRDFIEVYSENRFFTITGDWIKGTPTEVRELQKLLDELQEKYGNKRRVHVEFEQGKGLADWENMPNRKGCTLSEIRRKDSVLDEYLRGSLAGKPSPSEADMGTLERLMFWGYTPDEAVRILTHYRWRDKLLRRDYVEGMFQKLLPLKETAKSISLGDYKVSLEGSKTIVYDKTGAPVWSCPAFSFSGFHIKRDLARKLNLEEAAVDKAAAQLDHLMGARRTAEIEREKREDPNQGEVDPEIDKEADELLKDPELLYRINKALDCRLCGEHENRLFVVMAGVGARHKTVLVRLEGPNAVGKKMLYYWLAEVFGEENVVIITSATAAYWKRKALEGWDTRGKIIVCVEERGDYAGAVKYTFEQIYSEDKIVFGLNVKNEEGEWEPITIELQGPVLYVTTSTEPEMSLHAASREWSVKPDPSMEQTKAVDKWWRERELTPKAQTEKEKRQIQIVRAALAKLEPCDVKIPFIDKIVFPLEYLTDRRKARDFDNLIRYSALIHRKQRPTVKGTVYALPHDFFYAQIIAKKILAVSRGDLSADEKELLKFIREHPELKTWTKDGRAPDEKHPAECFKVSNIAERKEYRQLHEKTIRNILNSLARKRQIGKNAVNRSNVVYYDLPVEGESGTYSPSISPISTEELVSAISRVEESSTEDEKQLLSQVRTMMETPIVDPLTGTTLPYQTLYSSTLSKPESGSVDEKKPNEVERVPDSPLKSPNATQVTLDNLKAVYWAEEFFGEHECAVCGYVKMTSWKAETFKGAAVWLCEDCEREWEKREKR